MTGPRGRDPVRAALIDAGAELFSQHGPANVSVRQVARSLGAEMARAGFTGPAGIDLMIVEGADGALRLRVPLELNPRCTMGHIAMALARPLGSRSAGVWMLLTPRDVAAAGCEDFTRLLERLSERLPTQRHAGSLRQGAFATNDTQRAQQVLSVAIVAPEFEDAVAAITDVGLTDPTRPVVL